MPNRYNRERGKIGRTREEGGGGGMESESARRERRMESARGRVHTQQSQFLFFLCIPSLCGVKKISFLSGFAEQFQLSSNIVELLKEEAFDCQMALLGLSEENLNYLEGLKLGERERCCCLQQPACSPRLEGSLWSRCPRGHLRRPRTAVGAVWTTSPSGWRAWATAPAAGAVSKVRRF